MSNQVFLGLHTLSEATLALNLISAILLPRQIEILLLFYSVGLFLCNHNLWLCSNGVLAWHMILESLL